MNKYFSKRQLLVLVSTLVIIGVGVFLLISLTETPSEITPEETTEEEAEINPQIIGESVESRAIESYTFGTGDTHLLFVGGIHGGYEWNSVILAYQFIDYLEEKSEEIPENIKVSIIPNANPDGVYKVINKEGRFTINDIPSIDSFAPGRFNANGVDLNRNFECKWQPNSTWRGNAVSAGTEPFSEPEARALRDYILDIDPKAVIFWHSQANTVYASECEEGVIPETIDIMNTYANAANYRTVESFDAYEITGDAEGWLASINIPAITVELETHETIEWERNLSGVKALFNYYKN